MGILRSVPVHLPADDPGHFRYGTRQIIDFQVPGDFLGLRSVLLRTSDHSFEPITDITAVKVLAGDLLDAAL